MCKGGVHARVGSSAALGATTPRARSGPVRIFGHAGGGGLAEFRRYWLTSAVVLHAMHPRRVRRMLLVQKRPLDGPGSLDSIILLDF